MQPNNSPQQPPADPYAFLNEVRKPKPLQNLFSGFGGGSLKTKLVLGLVVILIVIVLIAVLKAAFSGNSQINTPSLYAVMSEQQELINLASIGSSQAQNPVNQDLAASLTGVLTTDQGKLINLLDYNHIKVNTAQFVLQPSVDNRLNQLQQSSSFDPLFTSVIEQQFGYYKSDLTNAYNLNINTVVRSYLKTDYANLNLLMKMLSYNYS